MKKRYPKFKIYLIGSLVCFAVLMMFTLTLRKESVANTANNKVVILMPFVNSDFLFENQKTASGLENLEGYVHSYKLVENPAFEIEIRYIDTTDESTYISQRNSFLLSDDQPELFFISNWSDGDVFIKSYGDKLIESGKVTPVANIVKGTQQLFEGLDFEYYLPIGIDAYVAGYTDAITSEYGFGYEDPQINEQQEDLMLMDWLKEDVRNYDWMIDQIIFEGLINPLSFLSEDFFKVEVTLDEIMDKIDALKPLFEKEKLIVEQGLEYDELVEYYQRLNNRYFRSGIEYAQMKNSYPVDFTRKANLTKAPQLAIESYFGGSTFYRNNPKKMESVGFMINKDGGDLDAAADFLEYLLSPAPQLSHYLYNRAYGGIVSTKAVKGVEEEEKIAHTSYQAMEQWRDFYSSLASSNIAHITTEDVALIYSYESEMIDLIRNYLLLNDIKRSELKRKLYELINTYEFRQVE
jgi:hypothetical protein